MKPTKRFVVLLIVLGVLLVLAPATPASATHILYRVEVLGRLPGDITSTARAINRSGQVAGWSSDGIPSAFIYTDGVGMVELAPLPGYTFCVANDINDAGQVAGSCGLYPKRAVRWAADGTPQDLGTFDPSNPNLSSEAHGINNAGLVVGWSDTGGDFASGTHAFLYSDQSGMIDLTPGSGYSFAHDINNRPGSPQVAGYVGSTAFRWSNGVLEPLGAPPGHAYSFGFGINDLGHVVGSSKILQSNLEYFARYTDRGGWQVLGTIGQRSKLWAVNNRGIAVGDGADPPPQKGLLYTPLDGVQDLDSYLDTPGVWAVSGGYDVNDAGQIAATVVHIATGEFYAARLTPVNTSACTTNCLRSTDVSLAAVLRDGRVLARGQVTVRDENGQPHPGAAVRVTWILPDGSLQPQVARANQAGIATFWTGGSRGTYALVVEDIRSPGYTFDARNSTRTATVTR